MRITDGGRRSAAVFPSAIIHFGALLPLCVLAWRAWRGDLTFNPIQAVIQSSGRTAVHLLLLSLAATPAALLLRMPILTSVRRPLGLYAFAWAALHMFTFAVVDFGLNLPRIASELREKAYLWFGLLAFGLLLSLAITSTRGWQKRLGRRWKILHRTAYVAAALALLHFQASQKAEINMVVVYYAPLLAVLLILRLPTLRKALAARR